MTKDRFSFVEFEGLDSDEKLIWINSYANCEILDHAQNNIPMMSINDAALLFSWLVHSNLPLRPQSRQNCISNSLLSLSSAIPKNNQAPVNSLAILKLLNDLLNYDSIQSDSKHKVNDTSKPGELILKHSSIVCQLLNITRSTPLQLWTNITQHSEKLIDIILQYCHVGIKRDANILSTAWQFILQAMEQLKNHSNIDLLLASVMASLAKQCCSHLTSIYRTPDHSLNSICILAKFYLSNLNILVKKMSHLLLSTHTLDSVFHILIVTRYIVMKEPYRTMTEASVVFKGLVSIPACLLQFGTFTFENRIFILNHFVSKYEFKYLSTFVALEDRDIYHSRVYFASLMFRYIEESSISSPISTSTTTVDTKQPMTQELVTVVDTFLRLIDQCYSFHFCGYQIESRSSLYDDALIGLILVILNLNLQTWTSIEKILWDRLLSSIQKHTVNFIIDVYLYLSDQGYEGLLRHYLYKTIPELLLNTHPPQSFRRIRIFTSRIISKLKDKKIDIRLPPLWETLLHFTPNNVQLNLKRVEYVADNVWPYFETSRVQQYLVELNKRLKLFLEYLDTLTDPLEAVTQFQGLYLLLHPYISISNTFTTTHPLEASIKQYLGTEIETLIMLFKGITASFDELSRIHKSLHNVQRTSVLLLQVFMVVKLTSEQVLSVMMEICTWVDCQHAKLYPWRQVMSFLDTYKVIFQNDIEAVDQVLDYGIGCQDPITIHLSLTVCESLATNSTTVPNLSNSNRERMVQYLKSIPYAFEPSSSGDGPVVDLPGTSVTRLECQSLSVDIESHLGAIESYLATNAKLTNHPRWRRLLDTIQRKL